jgi:hypothetical protein
LYTAPGSLAAQTTVTVTAISNADLSKSASAQVTITVAPPPPGSGNFDQYGGLLQVPSPNGATGHWRVEKFKSHWMLVTPDGNAFWSFGVFAIDPAGNYLSKYSDKGTWAEQTVTRLKSWGFNTILDHYDDWAFPISNSVKMPGVFFIRGDNWPIRNINGYCPAGASAKDIFQGINTTYYNVWIAPNTDPFDPCFAAWTNAFIAQDPDVAAAANSPWVIGFSMAEQDYMWALSSAGSSADFQTIPTGHNSPHLGYIVLITSPSQTYNSDWNVSYTTDTKVYAKYALRDFLFNRYGGSITALNLAWGSSYTTFDSSGGWGPGTGLLDEDGRHSWIPDWDTLAGATPAMKQDLDDFLQLYAEKFFQVQSTALKSRYPWMMYFGPNVMGAWGTPPRRQILQAAGQYIDVLMTSVGQNSPDDQQRLDWLMEYYGDHPIASWLGILANPDSPWSAYGQDWKSALTANTQVGRAQLYDGVANWYANATVSASIPVVGGTKPYVGLRWWAYADSGGEQANWGLTTGLDNAYDGIEARTGIQPCSPEVVKTGFNCGGEAGNYGDFINRAKNTNLAIIQALVTQLKP